MVLTGVEIAGLVLAVIPLLLPLLDQYKDGMNRTAVFFKRKKHVEKLAKALLIQRVLLAENVRTLLLRIEVDDVPEAPIDLFRLLDGNDDIKTRIESYLGKEAYACYMDAVASSERVVMVLIKAIDGFLPVPQPSKDDIIALIEASNATPTGQLVLKTRAKLTLSYHEMESSISELNRSIVLLERLHQAVSQRHAVEVSTNPTDRKAAKLASSLQTAQEHAIGLFNALVHSWNANCHQTHEAKMYLDGAKILNGQKDAKSTYFKKQKPFNFRLILSSKNADVASIWHESSFEVLEGGSSINGQLVPTAAVPRVNIVAPVAISPGGTITLIDVPNLCTTISWATRERKMLKWYLASQQRIQFQHDGCLDHLASTRCQTISLQDLLQPRPQTGVQIKMGLKNRMLLALNLASTLLQLQSTPWLANSWSKRAIEFLKRAPAAQTAMTGTSSAPAPAQHATALPSVPEDIDYEHPVISRQISTSAQHAHPMPSLPPKDALLELGIMLLELWHETTLERYYPASPMGQSGAPIPTEYWGRFMLASMWLEEPNDQPLPLYRTAISQCVKCFFGGTFPLPSWDDVNFRKALCKDLVEPLYDSCKQWM